MPKTNSKKPVVPVDPEPKYAYPKIDISEYYEHADKGSNTPRKVCLRWQEFNSPELSEPVDILTRSKDTQFRCPYPGCAHSKETLWRLRSHFRKSKEAHGSGNERGHNAELTCCPKCGATLKKGSHHTVKMCKGVPLQPRAKAEKAAGKRRHREDSEEEEASFDSSDSSDTEEATAPAALVAPEKSKRPRTSRATQARTTSTSTGTSTGNATRITCTIRIPRTRPIDHQAADADHIEYQATDMELIDHQATDVDPIDHLYYLDHQTAEGEQEPPPAFTGNSTELAATDFDWGPLFELASENACEPLIPQMTPLQMIESNMAPATHASSQIADPVGSQAHAACPYFQTASLPGPPARSEDACKARMTQLPQMRNVAPEANAMSQTEKDRFIQEIVEAACCPLEDRARLDSARSAHAPRPEAIASAPPPPHPDRYDYYDSSLLIDIGDIVSPDQMIPCENGKFWGEAGNLETNPDCFGGPNAHGSLFADDMLTDFAPARYDFDLQEFFRSIIA